MAIICFSGLAGVGKDTSAEVLTKKHGYTRIALADPLRELCSEVFKLPYNTFLDPDKKDSELDSKITLDFHHIDKIRQYVEDKWGFTVDYAAREEMEEYHGEEFNTPRDILKLVGTELIRNNLRDDIWIVLAFQKIQEVGNKVVITDCRFDNERKAFKKAGAILCLVKRPGAEKGSHASENTGSEDEYDVIFDNCEGINQLKSNVDMWYTIRRGELETQYNSVNIYDNIQNNKYNK